MNYMQIITPPKGEKLAIIPLREYNRLRSLNESDDDDDEFSEEEAREIKELMARVRSGEEPLIPLEVVKLTAIKKLSHVRAWRTYRKMTAKQLADKAGITRVYLTQIETRKRKGTVAVYKALAKALGTSVEALID